MKVELKKIEYSERMSEETMCFVADLYINGKKVGYCKNDGCGGPTDYRGYTKEDDKIIQDAEAYFKSLPKVKPVGYNFVYQPSLETAIDDFFEEWLKTKEEKKMQKLMETAIIWGKPNAGSYTFVKQKRKLSQFPTNVLQDFVDKLKAKHCTNGVVILNTNLTQLGINI
jgi:hypothetical protein